MTELATRPLLSGERLKIRRLRIEVAAGPDKGRSIALSGEPVVVGTAPDADLVLSDATVSQRHCEVIASARAVLVRDLDSTNGLYLGKLRVKEAYWDPGAKIRAGQTQLLLRAEGEEEIALSPDASFGRLVGASAPMRGLYAQLEAVASSDAPLLILGETGAGKELAAEAVHRRSRRGDAPLVVFDCGAAAPSLLEADLFGYDKGAFTGAVASRAGMAESADGGTLVLDEIGELPLELQPKLLRLIERQELRHLGSNNARRVDVRFIASTNRSLRAEVEAGRFREDLYYRLSALKVRIPALRERLDDLPLLVDRLLEEQGFEVRYADLLPADQQMLASHRWPGNVRELRNVVERFVTFGPHKLNALVEPETGAQTVDPQRFLPLPQARERATERFERDYLRDLMRRAQGSVTEAAKLAEVSRQFIQRLMRKHGMR
jgi:transcriptional regulator with GAF, ATPase, and Fis domain